jgi:hypothetical protein
MTDGPLSCGHFRDRPSDGCKVCHLYATSPRYRAAFDGLPLTPLPVAECTFLGRRAKVHGSNKDWHFCEHPDRPMGDVVCPCAGCGPKCVGFRSAD